jgi:hypothetical protein
LDTQTDSSAALDTNQAADAFAALLGSPEPEKKADAKVPETPEPEQTIEPEETVVENEPTVTVTIDGKAVEVNLSELKSSYQKDKASTERWMAAAETKKTAEAEIAKVSQERQAYAANLQRMSVQLEGALQAQQQNVNWDALLKDDPVEYLRQRHLAEQRQVALRQVQTEFGKVASQQQAEQQIAFSRHLETQQQALLAKLPEWQDETKAKAERGALRDYLAQEGFERGAIDNITDARTVLLARKAMMYDRTISKAQAAAKKVSTLPSKVESPGTGDNPGLDKRGQAFQRLSKSGRVEDAASVFASLLS